MNNSVFYQYKYFVESECKISMPNSYKHLTEVKTSTAGDVTMAANPLNVK